MRKLLAALLAIAGLGNLHAEPVRCVAAFYGDEYVGRKMANGQTYHHEKMICATWMFPIGTKLLVEYTTPYGSHRSVSVIVADRGPAKWLHDKKRLIDLSLGAFRQLENPRRGVIHVTIQEVK